MQEIGRNEFDNGYLSDVAVQSSAASDSDASVQPRDRYRGRGGASFLSGPGSAEKAFKHKYGFLKEAYEMRIKQLSNTIEGSVSTFLSDEIINNMSTHGITAAFIHQHLAEVFEQHLQNDREKVVHQFMTKLSDTETLLESSHEKIKSDAKVIQKLEIELKRQQQYEGLYAQLQSSSQMLQQKYKTMETQYSNDRNLLMKQNEELQATNSKLTQQLKDALATGELLEKDCENYRRDNMQKILEISKLEQSVVDTSHHLELLAKDDAEEKESVPKLQSKIIELSTRMDEYRRENYELKFNLKQCNQDLARIKLVNDELVEEQEAHKAKTNELMMQVEEMIAQETHESNATINAIHKKMKDLRQKLALDLQREMRVSAALQEEVNELKMQKQQKQSEFQLITDDLMRTKQNLEHEEQRVSLLQKQVSELNVLLSEAKSAAGDANARVAVAEKKLDDMERRKADELKIVEQKAYMEAQRNAETERNHLEKREMVYKLKQQNDFMSLQNQLRHSYTMGENDSASFRGKFEPSPSTNIFERISSMANNQDVINESMLAAKEVEFQNSMVKQKHVLEQEHIQNRNELQYRLDESMMIVDRLKRMAEEQREVIRNQEAQSSQLHRRYDEVCRELQERDQRIGQLQHENEYLTQLKNQSGYGKQNNQSVHHSQSFEPQEIKTRLFDREGNDTRRSNRYNSDVNSSMEQADDDDAEVYESHNHLLNSYNRKNVNVDRTSLQIQELQLQLQQSKGHIQQLEHENEQIKRESLSASINFDDQQQQIRQDSEALGDMKAKFESLMLHYGKGEERLKNMEAEHQSELRQHEQTVSLLQQNVTHLNDINAQQEQELKHLEKEFKVVHHKWNHGRQVLLSMETLYHDHIRGLRSTINQLRAAVEDTQNKFATEKNNLERKFIRDTSSVFSNLEKKYILANDENRRKLIQAHDMKEKQLEESFKAALVSKNKEQEDSKSELLRKVNNSMNISDESVVLSMNSAEEKDSKLVAKLKLILKGVVEALTSTNMAPSALSHEIQLIVSGQDDQVIDKSKKNLGVAANVCVLVRGHLSLFISKSTIASNQLEATKRELEKEIERRIFYENALSELQAAVGDGGSEMSSPASRLATLGTPSPNRATKGDEDKMLNELIQLEYKSQISVLQNRMEELQLTFKAELQRAEVAASDREATLRKTLESKYASAIQSDKQLILELENQLATEQTKRKNLQIRLNEEEKSMRKIIDELELRNSSLQTRAENSELSLTRLQARMKSQGV